jgi:hypothetical protein
MSRYCSLLSPPLAYRRRRISRADSERTVAGPLLSKYCSCSNKCINMHHMVSPFGHCPSSFTYSTTLPQVQYAKVRVVMVRRPQLLIVLLQGRFQARRVLHRAASFGIISLQAVSCTRLQHVHDCQHACAMLNVARLGRDRTTRGESTPALSSHRFGKWVPQSRRLR